MVYDEMFGVTEEKALDVAVVVVTALVIAFVFIVLHEAVFRLASFVVVILVGFIILNGTLDVLCVYVKMCVVVSGGKILLFLISFLILFRIRSIDAALNETVVVLLVFVEMYAVVSGGE